MVEVGCGLVVHLSPAEVSTGKTLNPGNKYVNVM